MNDSAITFKSEIAACTETLGISTVLLQTWVEAQINLGAQQLTILSTIHMAQRYQLDPLSHEIIINKINDTEYQAIITVDGWYRLINQHPAFRGISLRDATELIDEVPAWMECCIYREDRILPIVVREYLIEVRTEQSNWTQMPRRMLRHRVIQQCARLAFGWSGSEPPHPIIKDTTASKQSKESQISKGETQKSRRAILKEHLLQKNGH